MIDLMFDIGRYIYGNWDIMIASATLIVNGLIGLALIIPGDEPERTLSRIVSGLGKLSRKPKV